MIRAVRGTLVQKTTHSSRSQAVSPRDWVPEEAKTAPDCSPGASRCLSCRPSSRRITIAGLSQAFHRGLPLVGHPIHLLPGHAVQCAHVHTHIVDIRELFQAYWASRLTLMFLHVLPQSAPMFVAGAADVTAWFTPSICEQGRLELRDVSSGCTGCGIKIYPW